MGPNNRAIYFVVVVSMFLKVVLINLLNQYALKSFFKEFLQSSIHQHHLYILGY